MSQSQNHSRLNIREQSNNKGKGNNSTTFYKLLQEGGYIKESFNLQRKREREWHVKKIKTNLDSDFSSESD